MKTGVPKLTFYIIYIRDSVQLFHHFVYSLLEHSDCHFCLVSNACLEAEKKILSEICRTEERLTFCDLPTSENWKHGKALSYLYKINTSDFFCFMDSDIFATGAFMDEFYPYIYNYISISSCSSIWMLSKDKILPLEARHLRGRYNKTSSGINIGSSYFAIYNCNKMEQMIAPQEISFEKAKWQELNPTLKKKLDNQALVFDLYDTAKLLNLNLYLLGGKFLFLESNYLTHLGATSSNIIKKGYFKYKRIAKLIFLLPENYWKRQLLRLLELIGNYRLNIYAVWSKSETKVRKTIVSSYLLRLMDSLIREKKLPRLPWFSASEKEVQTRLEETRVRLQELFKN